MLDLQWFSPFLYVSWAESVSSAFKDSFAVLAYAKQNFVAATDADDFSYIASVSAFEPMDNESED